MERARKEREKAEKEAPAARYARSEPFGTASRKADFPWTNSNLRAQPATYTDDSTHD